MTRIAMCQILCLDGDRSGNFVRIEYALAEAREQGAAIACLPEMALIGWVNPDAWTRSFPIPGEDSDRLGELARKYGLHLCVGLGEKDGADLYNSVLLLDDAGRILLKHRKMNTLTELMTPPYARGGAIGSVETRFGRVSLLICADTFVGENLGRVREEKPDLLLVPYGWAAKEEAWPDHGKNLAAVVCNAAKITGAVTVGTDLVGQITRGPWAGMTYGGHSVAADAKGQVLAVCRDRDRDVVVFSVPGS